MSKILCALCVICFSTAFAQPLKDAKTRLTEIIDSSGLRKSDLGIAVGDGKKIIFSLNKEKKFIPASISKLITTAAVLDAFQPDYKFHTQIYVDGTQNDESLEGNIYVKGGGDPAFVSEKMWMIVDEFIRSGIQKISGDIIVDDSFFDEERFDKGRETERNDRAYDAPVGALSFDWNSTTIFVRPGKTPGEKAHVWIDPKNDYVEFSNKVVTSKTGTDLISSKQSQKNKDLITVTGKIAVGSPEKHIYKNVTDPALYAGFCFKEFLKQRNISVAGDVQRGIVPSSARLEVDFAGEPLSRLIVDMNKFSNNFIAEMLAKNLAAFKSKNQGTMKEGLEQIRFFLKSQIGWNEKDFNLANVSGFTRKNSFSPEQFLTLIDWMHRQFRLFPEFLQSLPIAGIDGTLEKRMKGTSAERWVRAKTGLLTGVVALAGSAGRHGDGQLNFAFIYNGSGEEAHVREVFDHMATSLTQ